MNQDRSSVRVQELIFKLTRVVFILGRDYTEVECALIEALKNIEIIEERKEA